MQLSDEQLLRYSRQIMLPDVDIAGQLALLEARVLIIGAGGLGCPTAMYLAAAGIGHLTIADHDVVDLTNLQRQIAHFEADIGTSKVKSLKATLQSLNSELRVDIIDEALTAETLLEPIENSDIVIDCSDNFSTRFAVNQACVSLKKPLVSGAAIRWEAQISVFDTRKPDKPCYHCLYGEGVGDEQLTCSENGVFSPLVGIIGAMQAQEAMKLAMGKDEDTLAGRLLIYDAKTARWREMSLKKDPSCSVCSLDAA